MTSAALQPLDRLWYVRRSGGNTVGPVTETLVEAGLSSGRVLPGDYVCEVGEGVWHRAGHAFPWITFDAQPEPDSQYAVVSEEELETLVLDLAEVIEQPRVSSQVATPRVPPTCDWTLTSPGNGDADLVPSAPEACGLVDRVCLELLDGASTTAAIEEALAWATFLALPRVLVAQADVGRAFDRLPPSTCIGTLAGSPRGHGLPALTAHEARAMVDLGVGEVVIALRSSWALGGDGGSIERVVGLVRRVVPVQLTVAVEVGHLPGRAIELACAASARAGADSIQLATCFGPRAATPEDVRCAARAVAGRSAVFARGELRDAAAAEALLEAGADGLLTPGAVALVGIESRQESQR